MRPKEQKKPRNPNKHPNSNQDAPEDTKDMVDTFEARTEHGVVQRVRNRLA
jgi:hypothetical protein